MIFLEEGVEEAKSRLVREMATGVVPEAEGCRRLLEIDPNDYPALRFFAETALENGESAEAERLARTMICKHPIQEYGYLLLARALREGGSSEGRVKAYARERLKRVQADEASIAGLDLAQMAELLGAEIPQGMSKEEVVDSWVGALTKWCEGESAEVAEEVEPHGLIFEIYASAGDLLSPETVDAILRRAEDTAPLLDGLLREWAGGVLGEDDEVVVERALALLGEIGDPASLPHIAEFLAPDQYLSGPAEWAFQRITSRRPEAALDVIQPMIAGSDFLNRCVLAHQLANFPAVPGRAETLLSLVEGIDQLPDEEREAIAVGTIAALVVTEGADNPHAADLERRFGGIFRGESRAELRKLRKFAREQAALPDEPSDFSVYQICCEWAGAEVEDDGEPVRNVPKPGRNDPCWCGSGKKYKKCHLDQDEHA